MGKELVLLRIDEILKHIDLTTSDLENVDIKDFKSTSLLARGTVFSLEQICEHISKLRKQFEKQYPEIKWDKIYDMRIVLAHMYVSVDCRIVYETVKNDLPTLKSQLLKIVSDLKR